MLAAPPTVVQVALLHLTAQQLRPMAAKLELITAGMLPEERFFMALAALVVLGLMVVAKMQEAVVAQAAIQALEVTAERKTQTVLRVLAAVVVAVPEQTPQVTALVEVAELGS